jgi:hypothetical protein
MARGFSAPSSLAPLLFLDCRPFTVRIDVDELEASSKEFVKLHGDSGFAASALIDEGEEAVEEAEVEARERRRRLMRRGKLDKWRYKADDDWVFSCSCGEVSLSTDPVSSTSHSCLTLCV